MIIRIAWVDIIRARQRAGRVDGQPLDLLGDHLDRALRVAAGRQRLGGADDELGQVEVDLGAAPRVGEQLERLLVVVRRLVGAADPAGLVAGLDAGGERGVEVHRQPGVPGQLGGGAADVAGLERGDVLRVQPHPLAGQQVVVHRLAEEGVPEGVGARVRRPGCSSRRPCAGPRRGRPASSPDAAASISWETLRPATLAARTTCRALSSRRSRRTRSTSARSAGTQLLGPDAALVSSSTKNALPSARSTMSASSFSASPSGTSSAISARTASSGSGESATRWTPRIRDHSATWRRSGWRRCRSSERYDATIATGPSKRREKRKLSMSRVDWSAQWVSSMTRSSGAFAAAVSSSACTASNRSVRSRAAAVVAALGRAHHPAAGLEPGERGVLGRDLLDDLGEVGAEPAEDLRERQVRQRAVAEVEAVAGADLPALGEGEVAQLGEQPGLPDTGVAGEEDDPRSVGRTNAEQRSNLRQLGVSPDQGPAGVCWHAVHDPVFCCLMLPISHRLVADDPQGTLTHLRAPVQRTLVQVSPSTSRPRVSRRRRRRPARSDWIRLWRYSSSVFT